jgi:hypothetical protein
MHKYKTMLTDFEGMQGVLDSHAAQGWRLFSLAPDTWRKVVATDRGMESPPFDDLDTQPLQEYCASYYLLVFARDDSLEDTDRLASLQEPFPLGQARDYED